MHRETRLAFYPVVHDRVQHRATVGSSAPDSLNMAKMQHQLALFRVPHAPCLITCRCVYEQKLATKQSRERERWKEKKKKIHEPDR